MLAGIVARSGPVRHLEMRLDPVGNVAQGKHGPLLPFGGDIHAKLRQIARALRRAGIAVRHLGTNLIAADILKADRFENMDTVDHPDNGGLPVDRLQDAPRGRRGQHIV